MHDDTGTLEKECMMVTHVHVSDEDCVMITHMYLHEECVIMMIQVLQLKTA